MKTTELFPNLKQLTNDQVNALYQQHPEIDTAEYKDRHYVGIGETTDDTILEVVIDDQKYIVNSNPHYGDTWYKFII